MSISILIYSYAIMSYFGNLETLFFESLNISKFFNQYSQIYTDYWLDKQEKIKQLLYYYEIFIKKYVKTFINSFETLWAMFQTIFWKKYKDQDLTQQINFKHFLEMCKNKNPSNTSNIL